MFGLNFSTKPAPTVNPVVQQFLTDAQTGKAILIDVRDISELKASGKIKGAKHIPLMQLANIADRRYPDYDTDLTLDAEIAVYCASGGRSGMASQVLRQLGFRSVTNLGGFGGLAAVGAQIERI